MEIYCHVKYATDAWHYDICCVQSTFKIFLFKCKYLNQNEIKDFCIYCLKRMKAKMSFINLHEFMIFLGWGSSNSIKVLYYYAINPLFPVILKKKQNRYPFVIISLLFFPLK